MCDFITNLDLHVDGGDGLDQISPGCRCHFETKGADLLIVQRLDQADQTGLPLHQESPSLVAVERLAPNCGEEPGLCGAQVHRAQGRSYRRVLGDGEGVLRLAEGGNEGIRRDHVDEGRHQRVFGWRTAVRGFDKEGQHRPLEVVHCAFSHHPTAVWLHLETSKITTLFRCILEIMILETHL